MFRDGGFKENIFYAEFKKEKGVNDTYIKTSPESGKKLRMSTLILNFLLHD